MVYLHSLEKQHQAGIPRYARELGAALERCGETVKGIVDRPLEVRLFGRRTGGYLSMRAMDRLRPLWKRDVLHATNLYMSHPRADIATVHDCFPEVFRRELGFGEAELRFLLRAVARIERRRGRYITPTQAVRTTFLDLHPEVDPERVHITYEGIAPSFCPPASGAPSHPAMAGPGFHVLSVGDLNPRKRLDWLLEALLSVDPTVQLIHVGSATVHRPTWQEQRRREEGLEARLGDRFTRLGHLDEAELLHLYQSADLLVLPSLDEGFGFPPLEALACGTPVAVTDRPVFREVLQDRASYFAGHDDLSSIIEMARRAGSPSDQRRRENLGFVRSHYDWDEVARRTRSVYDSLRGDS